MSKEIQDRLDFLVSEYPTQPLNAQKEDLAIINQLRAQLGLQPVDARLREVDPKPETPPTVEVTFEPLKKDHSLARNIYAAYLCYEKMMAPYRKYANDVVSATSRRGQTPVKPLATMGCHGGPLLCDFCGKPIVLEGGKFHGVNADEAWNNNPNRSDDWVSWILGGMVVELVSNGTVRVYHGYIGRSSHCCDKAEKANKEAAQAFVSSWQEEYTDLLFDFFSDEWPDMSSDQKYQIIGSIRTSVFSYDPGVGVNQPDGVES